MAKLEEVTQSE